MRPRSNATVPPPRFHANGWNCRSLLLLILCSLWLDYGARVGHLLFVSDKPLVTIDTMWAERQPGLRRFGRLCAVSSVLIHGILTIVNGTLDVCTGRSSIISILLKFVLVFHLVGCGRCGRYEPSRPFQKERAIGHTMHGALHSKRRVDQVSRIDLEWRQRLRCVEELDLSLLSLLSLLGHVSRRCHDPRALLPGDPPLERSSVLFFLTFNTPTQQHNNNNYPHDCTFQITDTHTGSARRMAGREEGANCEWCVRLRMQVAAAQGVIIAGDLNQRHPVMRLPDCSSSPPAQPTNANGRTMSLAI